MYLSVVIPTYNEEKRIVNTMNAVEKYTNSKKYPHEIIISDDGSTDRTIELVSDFAKKNENIKIIKNKHAGKGSAVRSGALHAKGECILFSDADLSTPIEEFEKLLPHLENGFDIAIGSRDLPGSNIILHQSIIRENLGKLFNKLVRLLVLRDFKDTQCGFKVFKNSTKPVFEKQTINGLVFDVEVLYIAKKMGFKIKEVPITWKNAPHSKISILKEFRKVIWDLLKIRFIH